VTSGCDLLIRDVRLASAPLERVAVAVAGRRIAAVGPEGRVASLAGSATIELDGGSGLLVPGFHDPHMHLLSWARSRRRLWCDKRTTANEVLGMIRAEVRERPSPSWIQIMGLDERLFAGQPLMRRQLDAAAPAHAVRLRHRNLHVDILNRVALERAGLWASPLAEVERDELTGEPTGRLLHAGPVLRKRLGVADAQTLTVDVAEATAQLLRWGVTAVQDVSATNDGERWQEFCRLRDAGALGVRATVLAGLDAWEEVGDEGRSGMLELGPIKVVLDEATTEVEAVAKRVSAARAAGRSVAIHAVSEAEVAIAIELLRPAPAPGRRAPDRIEHAATVPDDWLARIARRGVHVVGQPGLVALRGALYRVRHPVGQLGWLHRSGSFLRAGVPYSISSDAPVTPAAPAHRLWAAQRRVTERGDVLGGEERLGVLQALHAATLAPAAAVGRAHELGHLGTGALADLAVLDPEALEGAAHPDEQLARITVVDGRLAWVRRG
jgi:predicted amidohydrolase YtcJ